MFFLSKKYFLLKDIFYFLFFFDKKTLTYIYAFSKINVVSIGGDLIAKRYI